MGRTVGNRSYSYPDYDLTQHQNVSGQDLTYFDDEKKQKYIPYVIEPSLGADRMVLAFLCSAYDEEVLDAEKNDVRTVLHFHPVLAPVKIGVLPLSKKLNEGAEKIFQKLSKKYNCEFDDRGNINVTEDRMRSVHRSASHTTLNPKTTELSLSVTVTPWNRFV